jgi:uncharacterized protein
VAILQRGIASAIERAIETFPVVVLEGGRAVGKSTLCRSIIERNQWPALIDLSDPGTAEALRIDPLRYLRDLPSPAVIDEAQLVPELPLWVKRVVDDRHGIPRQFVLTGSARLGRHQLGGSDPLAGRAIGLRMWSMTPSELSGNPNPTSHALFDDAIWSSLITTPTVGLHEWDIREHLHGGLPGMPGVIAAANTNMWNRAMGSYIESVIPLGAASPRTDHARLLRTFRYLAANPAQQLNLTRAADELQVRADTARGYIESLEASFLVFRVEAHRPVEHKVLTAHPRLHPTDVGLGAWASHVIDAEPSAAILGGLLESQVAHDLAATLDWQDPRISLRHWRDQRSKHEVDLLLVHDDGRAIPIEVKSSISIGPDATKGIEAFAQSNSNAFVRGVVAYCGTRAIDLSPIHLPPRSILALPIDRLLHLNPHADL